ncbi:MAG: O-antigen ligase family protein [Rhizobacter sp.]
MLDPSRGGLEVVGLRPLLIASAAVIAGLVLAWHHPAAPAIAAAVFMMVCTLVAWRPDLWLFIVPALLPLANFAPWTGWVVFEEFDLLLLAVAAGGYARMALSGSGAHSEAGRGGRLFIALAVLLGLLSVVASAPGLSLAVQENWNGFQSYSDPLNSWRVFKSLFHAALIWPLLRLEIRRDAKTAFRLLAGGMLAGLTFVTLAVVWERLAYTGLWDFSTRYRTTALFWEMHVGGAAIDVYLALATPFVAWALWATRSPLRWSLAAALALLTGYACLTTFSRGVYGAVAGALVLLALLLRGMRLPRLRWRVVAGFALTVALAVEVAAVLGLGSFMRERMAASDHDIGGRLEHWQNGLGLLRNPTDWALGIGLGRLPAAYARAVPRRPFPGDVQFMPPGPLQPSGSVVVSGSTRPLDQFGLMTLTQRVALHPVRPHEVAFDVRAKLPADVSFQLCEMHLLYPRRCQSAWVQVAPGGATWRHVVLRLRGPALDPGPVWAPRMGVFSIAVLNEGGAAELDNISLAGPDRVEMLVNRDFSEGLARWYPAAQGYYVPWHIDNLYLELLIERGVFALLAFVLLMSWTLWRLVDAAGRGSTIAPFLTASLCGGLCVGLVSSVLDVPRVAFLMFLLTLYAFEEVGRRPSGRHP